MQVDQMICLRESIMCCEYMHAKSVRACLCEYMYAKSVCACLCEYVYATIVCVCVCV